MQRSYAEFDRTWGLGCAGIALSLVTLLLLAYSNPVQRIRLRVFPPGTAVPVAELRPDGPPVRGFPSRGPAASTSLDALRRALSGGPCPYPPPTGQRGCWTDVDPAPGMLLVAAVPTGCGSREWYGWTNGSTLTIELATWGCIQFRNRDDAGQQAGYALLGVPLGRLPHGHLLVGVVDSVGPPVPITVP